MLACGSSCCGTAGLSLTQPWCSSALSCSTQARCRGEQDLLQGVWMLGITEFMYTGASQVMPFTFQTRQCSGHRMGYSLRCMEHIWTEKFNYFCEPGQHWKGWRCLQNGSLLPAKAVLQKASWTTTQKWDLFPLVILYGFHLGKKSP